MFSNIVIKELFADTEQEQIHVYSFFVDKKDLKDENLKSILINKDNRKRGLVINFDNNNYILSLNDTVLEYDEDTKALLSDVKKADALSGARGNSFMQQSVARGMQAAGENGGGTGMAFMGMGMQAGSGMMQGMQQPTQTAQNPFINVGGQAQQAPQEQPQQTQPQAQQVDPYEELKKS